MQPFGRGFSLVLLSHYVAYSAKRDKGQNTSTSALQEHAKSKVNSGTDLCISKVINQCESAHTVEILSYRCIKCACGLGNSQRVVRRQITMESEMSRATHVQTHTLAHRSRSRPLRPVAAMLLLTSCLHGDQDGLWLSWKLTAACCGFCNVYGSWEQYLTLSVQSVFKVSQDMNLNVKSNMFHSARSLVFNTVCRMGR